MHWNLVSNMPLSQSLWFSLDSLLPHSFPPKQNSGVGGVWSPLGASAEPLPHPTLASAHQDAIISGARSITWSRKAPFTYVYISYNKFTPLLILLFTMNMAKVTIGFCPLSRAPANISGGATTLLWGAAQKQKICNKFSPACTMQLTPNNGQRSASHALFSGCQFLLVLQFLHRHIDW